MWPVWATGIVLDSACELGSRCKQARWLYKGGARQEDGYAIPWKVLTNVVSGDMDLWPIRPPIPTFLFRGPMPAARSAIL